MLRRGFLFLTFFMMSVIAPARGGPTSLPEILIVGTYHMANRGHDVYNIQADDVLSPKRQQEIAQLIDVLKKFRPTRIAVEADIDNKQLAQQYADYLTGKYALSRDETNQVGFRLAKELGHKTVYPVNDWADFPLQRVSNYAKANGREAEFHRVMAEWGTLINEMDTYLKSHTILETIKYINSDAIVFRDVSPYFELARFGEPGEYAGPDLLASWYERNIRIYHNIVNLIESPNDRVLVIYGYGHLGWLQQNAANDATVRLRKLDDFTDRR